MTTVREACRHVRSKNAGPYWVTIDLFFKDDAFFRRYSESPRLGPVLFHRLFGADQELVQHHRVADLGVLKVSYPRTTAQGGEVERDMHRGQQFVRLLDVELD
jgi:hypothetical protein